MAMLLRIVGLVQGVGYRAWFDSQARALKLSGWVRNRRDGSVEALVDGEPAALEAITALAWCGPASAQVHEVTVTHVSDARGENDGFSVQATR
jgi:acylphosphatase